MQESGPGQYYPVKPAGYNGKRYHGFIAFLCISMYFCIFQNFSAFSQSDSLSSYLEIAIRKNPLVNQRFYEYQAALQKVPQAGSLPDPELSAGVFLKPMELIAGNQLADLRLMQMFPWFGVLRSAKDEMSLMAKAKFESFRDAKLEVCYNVQETWYELFKVRKNISISERNTEILKTIERLATSAYKATYPVGTAAPVVKSIENSPAIPSSVTPSGMQGMSSAASENPTTSMKPSQNMASGSMVTSGSTGLVDLYMLQIEEGDLVNSIALLKDLDRYLMSQFNGYLNRPANTQVFVPADLAPDSIPFSVQPATDSILKNNPMLSMITLEQQSLDAKKKMIKGMGYPMVGVGLDYSVIGKNAMSASSMNGKDMIMPMISLTLPVYRKKYKAMENEADLLGKASSYSYEAAVNSLNTSYYDALKDYADAGRRVKLFRDQFDLASGSFDIMLRSFSSAGASLADLLRIRQQTFEYELKQAEALADLYITAARLKRLMASVQ